MFARTVLRSLAGAVALFVALPAAHPAGQADPQILTVQTLLREDQLYPGKLTGILDTDTVCAIRRYQIVHGFRVTGQLDRPTREAMKLPEKELSESVIEQDRKFLQALTPQPTPPPAIAEALPPSEQKAHSSAAPQASPPEPASKPAVHRSRKRHSHYQ